MIPIAALIVSLAVLIMTWMSLRNKAELSYVKSIDERLKDCENSKALIMREIEWKNNHIKTLEDKNLDLMQKLIDARNK